MRVRAADGTAANAKRTQKDVTVTITDDTGAFRISAGQVEHGYAENRTAVIETYTASDAGGNTVSWSLEGTDAADFSIGASNGQLEFASTPDFEAPADSGTNNVYNVTVKATAGTDNATRAVTVTVSNVDEPIAFTAGPTEVTREEGASKSVAGYTAVDPEGEPTAWILEGTDSDDFTIARNGNTQATLSFVSAPDFANPTDSDGNNVYNVTVVAADQVIFDQDPAKRAVTVTVTQADTENSAPTITGGGATHNYNENGTGAVSTYTATDADDDTITWSLEGTDKGDFTLINGVLRFRNSPNFESPHDSDTNNTYKVTVKASDASDSATLAVTVTVVNVDEAPVITGGATSPSFTENGTGNVATYTATDPEGDAISWSVAGTDASAFTISSAGVLKFNSPPDYDTKNSYSITVKATANNKSGTRTVSVTIVNVNEAPTLTAGGATHNYAENGTAVIHTYTATDPEGATLIWSLEGTDAADFTITGGALKFASTPDHESPADSDENNIYSITVKVTDGTNPVTRAVTVTVTNVNEAPTLTGSSAVTKVADVGKVVATYTATDPENATIQWSLSGTDAADFTITGGVLTFKVVPDDDNPHDSRHQQHLPGDHNCSRRDGCFGALGHPRREGHRVGHQRDAGAERRRLAQLRREPDRRGRRLHRHGRRGRQHRLDPRRRRRGRLHDHGRRAHLRRGPQLRGAGGRRDEQRLQHHGGRLGRQHPGHPGGGGHGDQRGRGAER